MVLIEDEQNWSNWHLAQTFRLPVFRVRIARDILLSKRALADTVKTR